MEQSGRHICILRIITIKVTDGYFKTYCGHYCLLHLSDCSAEKLIFRKVNPIRAAKKYVPVYMGLAGFIIALVTIKKGLKHIGLGISTEAGLVVSIAIAIVVGIIGRLAIRQLKLDATIPKESQSEEIEKIFAVLMIVTACCMAFAHGSNDVANAIGPLAAIVSIINSDGVINNSSPLDWWILPWCSRYCGWPGLIWAASYWYRRAGHYSPYAKPGFCSRAGGSQYRGAGVGNRVTNLNNANAGGRDNGRRWHAGCRYLTLKPFVQLSLPGL